MCKKFLFILSLLCLNTGYAQTASVFIIDTDMGIDDVMAITYFMSRPEIRVAAITVEANGISHCKYAIPNLAYVLKRLHHRAVRMACGADKMLAGAHSFPPGYRRQSDTLAGIFSGMPKYEQKIHYNAVHILEDVISKEKNISILAIGPLTNIAQAIEEKPQIIKNIKHIYFMGGAVKVPGNVKNKFQKGISEWNIYADPLSAKIIFNSGVPITLIPLDATNQLPIDEIFFRNLQAQTSSPGKDLVKQLILHNFSDLKTLEWSFWDPLAAVIAANHALAEMEKMHLRVLTQAESLSGCLVSDNKANKIDVLMHVDKLRFEDTFSAGL